MSQVRAIIDQLLTKASSALIAQGHVSESLLPGIQVKEKTGKLAKYGNDHLRIMNTIMGGRGEARRVEVVTRSQSSYDVESHGLEGLVTPDDYRNVQLPYKAEEDEVTGLTSVLWLGKEKSLADTLTDTAIITQNTTKSGAAQYNNYTSSDPLADFAAAQAEIKAGCGVAPNAAVLSWEVYNKLKYHPAILEGLGFTQNRAGLLSRDDLMRALDVKQLFIAEAVYNSAKKGQADVIGPVWGKHIVFFVRPDQAAPYQVSLGYYLTLDGEQPRKVYKYAINNPPESTGIIATDNYDMFLSNAAAAYLIKDAIA